MCVCVCVCLVTEKNYLSNVETEKVEIICSCTGIIFFVAAEVFLIFFLNHKIPLVHRTCVIVYQIILLNKLLLLHKD
jgi:hypothetical protein